jgi:hypothetical protein
MQKRAELDWVGCVLRDVITFLAENNMFDSASMLSAVAAHIEDERKRQKPDPTVVDVVHAELFRSTATRRVS